jgi:hypothetical protein
MLERDSGFFHTCLEKENLKGIPNNFVNQTTIKGRRVYSIGLLASGLQKYLINTYAHVIPLKKKTCKIGLKKEEKGRL